MGAMKTGGQTVLLLGDSLIEYGDWHELLGGYHVVNRGMAGETVGGLSARLGWETERTADPDHILIMSGTNDLLMGDRNFSAVFATMLPRLKLLEPDADISVVGIAPMRLPGLHEELLQGINCTLRETVLQAGCRFVDIVSCFHLHCRPVGNPCFLMDGVHFSPHGYKVLAAAVREHLESYP
ncbi:MAG: GDSL-type esterase/lipase family protein [Desulfobulbaceae bacterium]|nr:GDSL-type esterase/lipase family protein [Desulfobulbaceae bacterium]